MKKRFVVYEQSNPDDQFSRVGDIFGIFYSYDRANILCSKLQQRNPEQWYGIRELLHGNHWLKD